MDTAPRSLWLGFGKAQKKVKFQALDDQTLGGKFDDMFECFPFTSSDPEPLFALPHEPQINTSDGLSMKLPFPRALAWGDGIDTDSAVFFIGFHGDSGSDEQTMFCVKVLFNIEKTEPDDNCYKAVDKMLADAKFYGKNLRGVAGDLVPRHYGVWRARTGEWGGVMLCSITEWAGIPWTKIVAAGRGTDELKIQIGRTVERLHDRGIHHHGLYHPADLHHLLFRAEDSTAWQCFVVDFSKAMMMPCERKLPILPLDADVLKLKSNEACEEAINLVYILGMYRKGVKLSPSTQMYRAIRFHERYSALYPSLSNVEVMVVQRHHFFSDAPLLEPDSRTFGFRQDGMVVFDAKGDDTLTERLSEGYIAELVS